MHFYGSSAAFKGMGSPENLIYRITIVPLILKHQNILFQGFNLLKRMTVLDNVALPLLYAGMEKVERREKAQELLARMGLAAPADGEPGPPHPAAAPNRRRETRTRVRCA
jgi:ABC-type histidine transport system ATPase subunit